MEYVLKVTFLIFITNIIYINQINLKDIRKNQKAIFLSAIGITQNVSAKFRDSVQVNLILKLPFQLTIHHYLTTIRSWQIY
ncbi:unnamed protein product [Paramecium primaurelia]|uniref:Uncharacterized protein n=1 Tax=Paramecium primaurelia TaxID=5886 RepID=A0A8S1QVC2_PARPR|nr:unnamed protein product [Paramecium primaurelia]